MFKKGQHVWYQIGPYDPEEYVFCSQSNRFYCELDSLEEPPKHWLLNVEDIHATEKEALEAKLRG